MKTIRQHIALASLLALTACTQEQATTLRGGYGDVPIEFGVYVGRSATGTRAGQTGTMDLAKMKDTGFGIFAQHQDNGNEFDFAKHFDFMWNQKVTWNTSANAWEYTPVKYWPNEVEDKLSFFAYAPYIPHDPISTELDDQTESNYIFMSSNAMRSDNTYILYHPSTDPANSVDLLYANLTDQGKPTTAARLQFQFKHALTRLDFNVRGIFDETTAGNNTKDTQTKILIDNIRLVRPSLAHLGKFHLCPQPNVANPLDHPYWEWDAPYFAKKDFVVKNNIVRESLRFKAFETTYTNEQSATYFSETLGEGVGNTDMAVCHDGNQEQYFLLIPNEEIAIAGLSPLVVNIVYYVITRDEKLVRNKPAGLSIVKNDITVQLPAAFQFEHAKSYHLKLQLGLTTAKFTVTQASWDFEEPTIPENEHIILEPLVVAWKLADEEHVELLENIVYYPADIETWVVHQAQDITYK